MPEHFDVGPRSVFPRTPRLNRADECFATVDLHVRALDTVLVVVVGMIESLAKVTKNLFSSEGHPRLPVRKAA